MMFFTTMVVLDTAYYGLRIYSCASDPHLYPSLNDVPGGGLGRLFRLPSTLLLSTRRFKIGEAVRGSFCSAMFAEAMFH